MTPNGMRTREVVLDIETVPCRKSLWDSLPADLKKKYYRDDVGEGEAWKRTALDWTLGRIACICLRIVEDRQPTDKCFCGSREAGLLRALWKTIRRTDLLVGYNLLDFDLPFIQARCVINRVRLAWPFDLRRYRYDPVCDLMQIWGSWNRANFAKLGLLANVLGLEAKAGSAEKVFDWYRRKDWKRIQRYCLQDVHLTHQVYERLRKLGLTRHEDVG